MKKLAWIFIAVSCCSYAADSGRTKQSAANDLVMEYRYWDLGASSKRDIYQRKLLELALEKSRSKYGEYRLTKIDEKFTSLRATREVSKGELINIEASPYKLIRNTNPTFSTVDLITSKVSILKNLLGYRVLIVKKENLSLFENISEAKLKTMTAGQAQDWSDVIIYRVNGYKVDDDANFNNLMAMLVAGRVDYVPMSVIEAESVIKQFPRYHNQVSIVPNLLIYYPFPVHFNMSVYTPKLAERLEYGLELAKKDGSFDALFNQHFFTEYSLAQNPNNKVFRLHNPNIPSEE